MEWLIEWRNIVIWTKETGAFCVDKLKCNTFPVVLILMSVFPSDTVVFPKDRPVSDYALRVRKMSLTILGIGWGGESIILGKYGQKKKKNSLKLN